MLNVLIFKIFPQHSETTHVWEGNCNCKCGETLHGKFPLRNASAVVFTRDIKLAKVVKGRGERKNSVGQDRRQLIRRFLHDRNLCCTFRKLGWRLGLQSVTGALSLAFFLGLIYRSASLYHPQRRAILQLKNQRNKVKEKKSATKVPKQPLVDLSPLGSRPVRMLMLAAGFASFGLYTPAFYIVSALSDWEGFPLW